MIRDIFDESTSLELAVGRLELQQDVSKPSLLLNSNDMAFSRDQRYDEWREIWRNDDGERDLKFEAYAKSNPAAARRILRQLALLSLALFDADALEFQYGIKPVHWPDRVTHFFPSLAIPLIVDRNQRTFQDSDSKKVKP
jgi:hypothetical protein